MKFEEALDKLEEIVNRLESGEGDLDEILKLYEEGTSLVKLCNRKLKEVEVKIETVTSRIKENAEANEGVPSE